MERKTEEGKDERETEGEERANEGEEEETKGDGRGSGSQRERVEEKTGRAEYREAEERRGGERRVT